MLYNYDAANILTSFENRVSPDEEQDVFKFVLGVENLDAQFSFWNDKISNASCVSDNLWLAIASNLKNLPNDTIGNWVSDLDRKGEHSIVETITLISAYVKLDGLHDILRIITEFRGDINNFIEMLVECVDIEGSNLSGSAHLQILQHLHEIYPDFFVITKLLAKQALCSGRPDITVTLYEKSSNLTESENVDFLIACRLSNQLEKGINYGRKIDGGGESINEVYYHLSHMYYDLSQEEEARNSFLKIDDVVFNNTDVYLLAVKIYNSLGDYIKVVEFAEKILEEQSGRNTKEVDDLLNVYINAFLLSDSSHVPNYDKFLFNLQQWLSHEEISKERSLHLAMVFSHLGDIEQATQQLETFTENSLSNFKLVIASAVYCMINKLSTARDVLLTLDEFQVYNDERNYILSWYSAVNGDEVQFNEHIKKIVDRRAHNFLDTNYLFKLNDNINIKEDIKKSTPIHAELGYGVEWYAEKNVKFELPEGIRTPVITIVVPCHNEARFLSDALYSVWFQSYPLWECIIVNDASSDASEKIARAYVKADSRFKLVNHDENQGLAASRNTGLALALGTYITFLDADDYLYQACLASRYERLCYSSPDVAGVYCGVEHSDEKEQGSFLYSREETSHRIVSLISTSFQAPFNAHAPLLKVDILKEVNGFDEEMRNGAEDWDCWTRLIGKGYKFNPTNSITAAYRKKRGSMVRSLASKHVLAVRDIFKKNFAFGGNGDDAYQRLPIWAYSIIANYCERSISFATMAYIANDEKGFNEIIFNMPGNKEFLNSLGIRIDMSVKAGVERYFANADLTVDKYSRNNFEQRLTDDINNAICGYVDDREDDVISCFFNDILQIDKLKASNNNNNSGQVKTGTPFLIPQELYRRRCKRIC